MEQLLEVTGLSLNNTIFILNGEGNPGDTDETINAPSGSVYYTVAGDTWKKTTAGSGADKWTLETGAAVDSGILSVSGVPANQVKILDLLDRTKIETAVWSLTIRETAHPENKEVVTLTGSHNDSQAKYATYSRLTFGSKIPVLNYSVQLVANNLQLVASAGVGIDIECYRLSAVAKGTIQIIGGGTGTGDVTSAQLIAESVARSTADTAIQTAIDSKADITAVATQFANVQAQIAALPSGGSGTNGTNGVDGKSAYELAVINGYVGTEAQWLLSLKGADGSGGAGGLPSGAGLGELQFNKGGVVASDTTMVFDDVAKVFHVPTQEFKPLNGSSRTQVGRDSVSGSSYLRHNIQFITPNPVYAKYWKINVTSSTSIGSPDYLMLWEVAVRDLTDVNISNTASWVSSRSNNGFNLAGIYNGQTDGGHGMYCTGPMPVSLTATFPDNIAISRIGFAPAGWDTTPYAAPKDFTIEYSSDGVTWTVLKAFSNVGGYTIGQLSYVEMPSQPEWVPYDLTTPSATVEVLGSEISFNFADVNSSVLSPGVSVIPSGLKFKDGSILTTAPTGGGSTEVPSQIIIKQAGDASLLLQNAAGVAKAYVGTAGAFGSDVATDSLRIRSDSSEIDFGFSGFVTHKLLDSGDLQLRKVGGGLVFPDGSKQTTAILMANVNTAIQAVVGAAPAALDTLKEIADQLAMDESAVGAITTSLSNKADKSSIVAQVNSDWSANAGVSQILNKPTVVSAFINDSNYQNGLFNVKVNEGSNVIAARYWKVTLGATPNGNTRIAELTFWDGEGTNISADATYANTTGGNGFTPAGALLDGSTGTYWDFYYSPAVIPATWASAVSIKEVRLSAAGLTDRMPTQVTIAYSLDGVIWVDLANVGCDAWVTGVAQTASVQAAAGALVPIDPLKTAYKVIYTEGAYEVYASAPASSITWVKQLGLNSSGSYIRGDMIIGGVAGVNGLILPDGTKLLTAGGSAGPQGIQGQQGIQGIQGLQGEVGLAGTNGAPGSDGKSAYEIAVLAGFVGDEAAWLLSLKGADGTGGSGVTQIAFDAEVTARADAILAVAQNIASEATFRASSDAALQASLDALQVQVAALPAVSASHYEVTFTDADVLGGVLTISHALNRKYVSIQIYDENDLQIIPDEVHPVNVSDAEVTLTTFLPITGTWTAVAKR